MKACLPTAVCQSVPASEVQHHEESLRRPRVREIYKAIRTAHEHHNQGFPFSDNFAYVFGRRARAEGRN